MVLFWILLTIILLLIIPKIYTYIRPPTKLCQSQICLFGKTIVITGANTGIGFETAIDFAKRGAKVILACRNMLKAELARREIMKTTNNKNIFVKILDLSSFQSVRAFAQEMNETEDRLDILVNNAGMTYGNTAKTEDGYNMVMQVNYYSHFLLSNLLLDLMAKSGEPSRIINVSSLAAAYAVFFDVNNIDKFQGNLLTYAKSKLCNILFTKQLAKKLQSTTITTFSLHPGCLRTDIFRNAKGFSRKWIQLVLALFFKSLSEGAQTVVYCSVEKNIGKFSGQHFDNCRKVADYRTAKDLDVAEKLWQITEDIVNLQKEVISKA